MITTRINRTDAFASRAVITSLVMAAVLSPSARGEVSSQPPAPAPAPSAIVLTPPTGTVGARGTGDMPGTETNVLELTLPEATARTFSRGGVIEVPADTILTKMNLTVAASESSWIDEQDLLLEIHEGERSRAVMSKNVSVVTIDGLKVARFATTDVADPVVITAESPVRVRGVIRKKRITQEWILRASASPARVISEQAGAQDGVRLTIAIDEMTPPPILSREVTKMDVIVKGRVTPTAGLTRLAVAGIAIQPDRREASQAFTATVPIDVSMREFVVEAEDEFGRLASVVVPVAVPAGMRKKQDESK